MSLYHAVGAEAMDDLEAMLYEPLDVLTLKIPAEQSFAPHCLQCFSLLSYIYFSITNLSASKDTTFLSRFLRHSDFSPDTHQSMKQCPICHMATTCFALRYRHDRTLGCDIVDGALVSTWSWIWHFLWSAKMDHVKLTFHAIPDFKYRKEYNEGVWMDARLDIHCELQQSPADLSSYSYEWQISPDLTRINTWLNGCLDHHSRCRQLYHSSDERWYPDRLIYYDTSGSRPRFRLVQKNVDSILGSVESVEGKLSYIALSHCWGPPPDSDKPHGGRVVLTNSTIDSWSLSLPQNIARTQADALALMVMLGMKFMWIDSLCIVQDSLDDWFIQSAVMSDTYKHATFTIAALAAISDDHGLFSTAPEYRFPAAGFDLPGQDILLKWEHNDSVTHALHHRAWTYQERELSRRTIGFSFFELHWACDEHTQRECPDLIAQKQGLQSPERLQPSSIREHIHKTMRKNTVGSADLTWERAARRYMDCSLTVESDKLVAISAIASELAKSSHGLGRYLAGLWEHNFYHQLAWHLDRPGKRTANQTLPTWSWLSIISPCPLKMDYPESFPLSLCLGKLRNVQTSTVSDFEFGSITGGTAQVSGRVRPVSRHFRQRGGALGRYVLVDAETRLSLRWRPDAADISASDAVYWIPHTIRTETATKLRFVGLVLREISVEALDSDAKRTFERIGYCYMTYPDQQIEKSLAKEVIRMFADFQQEVFDGKEKRPLDVACFQQGSVALWEDIDLI